LTKENDMSKYPYQVRVNEEKDIEKKVEADDGSGSTTVVEKIKVWRTVGKQESLNEARKVAEGHAYNRDHEDVRIERVNGRLIECAGKLE
jgi:hypothetical protein